MKITMLDYLATQVADYAGEGQLDLNWDKKEHVFEITLSLTAQNKAGQEVTDVAGKLSTQDKIDFQDQILIYDEKRLDPAAVAEDYLALLPFSGKTGLAQQTIDGLFAYLPEVMADGLSDLMAFLNEDTVTTFELKWQPRVFEQQVTAQGPIKATDYLAYPRY
jgi:DNA-3-methyladenine glycosylase